MSILIHTYVEKSEKFQIFFKAMTADTLWFFLPTFFHMDMKMYFQYFDISYSFHFSCCQSLATSLD